MVYTEVYFVQFDRGWEHWDAVLTHVLSKSLYARVGLSLGSALIVAFDSKNTTLHSLTDDTECSQTTDLEELASILRTGRGDVFKFIMKGNNKTM